MCKRIAEWLNYLQHVSKICILVPDGGGFSIVPLQVVRSRPRVHAGVSEGAKDRSGINGDKGTSLRVFRPADVEPSLQSNLEV